MKVRVSYTVEVDNHFRRAIREYYGESGLATRKEVQSWYENFGDTMNDELSEMGNDDDPGYSSRGGMMSSQS